MEEAEKNYVFKRQGVVSWCTCDPLVVIASDIQVRIAGKVFLTGYCKTIAYIICNSFFQRRSINLLLYFSKGRLDFVVVFLYVLNRSIEDNECVV